MAQVAGRREQEADGLWFAHSNAIAVANWLAELRDEHGKVIDAAYTPQSVPKAAEMIRFDLLLAEVVDRNCRVRGISVTLDVIEQPVQEVLLHDR